MKVKVKKKRTNVRTTYGQTQLGERGPQSWDDTLWPIKNKFLVFLCFDYSVLNT